MSFYQCKDVAQKIIPSIASTNSIAASLQILAFSKFSQLPQTRQGYISIKTYAKQDKIQTFIAQKSKPYCLYCSQLYQCQKIFASMSEITWQELQDFLCQQFISSFKVRDIYCNEYVVVRNKIRKGAKVAGNKGKVLDWNEKLIGLSKCGERMMCIQYMSHPLTRQNSNESVNVAQMSEEELESYTRWKFIIIDIKSQNGQKNESNKETVKKSLKIYCSKKFDKQNFHEKIRKCVSEYEVAQIRTSQMREFQNSDVIIQE